AKSEDFKKCARALDELKEETERVKQDLKPKIISHLVCNTVDGDSMIENFVHDISSMFPQFLRKYTNCYGVEMHPIDVRNTIFFNLNEEMCCFLGRCLYENRFAIPFLLRDIEDPPSKLKLVNLFSAIYFQPNRGSEKPLANEALPIVSWTRFGQLEKQSKSDILNMLLMDTAVPVFYTKNLKNAWLPKVTQNGTVDMAWHHQSDCETPKSVILNAHGDLEENPTLFNWLANKSDVMVIFAEKISTRDIKKLEKTCANFLGCKFMLVLLDEIKCNSNSIKVECCKNLNLADIVEFLEKEIYNEIQQENPKSISTIVREPNPLFDEVQGVTFGMDIDKANWPKSIIEVHNDSQWKDYSVLVRSFNRIKPSGTKSIEELTTEAGNKKVEIEKQIREHGEKYMTFFESLCDVLLKAKAQDPLFGFDEMLSHLNLGSKDTIFRRIAQSYELSESAWIKDSVALDLVTKLLLDGNSVEILDGTESKLWMYTEWVSHILTKINESLPDAKVVVLS
ncbi:hypothetical protein Ciccas_014178, partial [Cichlidogyrus casuarinus]